MRRNIFQITALLFMGCLLANTVSSASTGLVPGLHLRRIQCWSESDQAQVRSQNFNIPNPSATKITSMGLGLTNYNFPVSNHLSYDAKITQLNWNTLQVSINSTAGSRIRSLAFSVIVVDCDSVGVELHRHQAEVSPSIPNYYYLPQIGKTTSPLLRFSHTDNPYSFMFLEAMTINPALESNQKIGIYITWNYIRQSQRYLVVIGNFHSQNPMPTKISMNVLFIAKREEVTILKYYNSIQIDDFDSPNQSNKIIIDNFGTDQNGPFGNVLTDNRCLMGFGLYSHQLPQTEQYTTSLSFELTNTGVASAIISQGKGYQGSQKIKLNIACFAVECLPGQQVNSQGYCGPEPQCPASCQTCLPYNQFVGPQCTSCKCGLFLRPDHLCYDTCLDGSYPNSQTHICDPCPNGCSTCEPPTPVICVGCEQGVTHTVPCTCTGGDYCTACSDGFVMGDDHKCQRPTCLQGFYIHPQNYNCYPCPNECTTCEPPTPIICVGCEEGVYHTVPCTCTGGDFCTDCKPGFELDSDHKCISICTEPATYYDLNTQQCQPCMENCKQCSTGTTCDVCEEAGFYLDQSDNTCKACPFGCAACQDAVTCDSCIDGYYFRSGSNICWDSCLPGTYPYPLGQLCRSCPSGCATCTSPTTCTSCLQNYYFRPDETLCSDSCLEGTYPDGQFCKVCPSGCSACTDINTCTSCVNNFYFRLGQTLCSDSCLPGTYVSGMNCLACFSHCDLCSSGSTCDQCSLGYQYNEANPQCQPCLLGCATCSDSISCDTCAENYYFRVGESVCSDSCLDGTYPFWDQSAQECRPCLEGCQTCLTGSTCQTCLGGYFHANSICNLCPSVCQECTSSTQCQSCVSGYYFWSSDNFCHDTCELRYYFKQILYTYTAYYTCQPCFYDCYSCSDSTTCLTCSATLDHRTFNTVTKRCDPLPGFYESGVTEAGACMLGCVDCTNATYCLQCISNQYFSKNGICTAKKGCNTPNCLECNEDGTICTKCIEGMIFNPDSKKCINQSPGNSKKVAASGSVVCPQNCISCQTPFDCSQCASGYQFVSSTSKCEPALVSSGMSPVWLALPSIVGAVALVIAVVMVAKYRRLKREAKEEDKDSIKSSNAMMKPDIDETVKEKKEGMEKEIEDRPETFGSSKKINEQA